MKEHALDRFIQIIEEVIGLYMREDDRPTMEKILQQRMKKIKLSTEMDYIKFIEGQTTRSQAEWSELVALLTTGESFFFRDQRQLSLVRAAILPEIIEQNRDKKTLRVWSAGCSTGEETYTLAILIQETMKKLQGWKVRILGTDVNPSAIQRAKEGIYGKWSFRMVDPKVIEQYFSHQKQKWEIKPQIREMVEFQTGNLILDKIPNPAMDLHDFDLIFCRNVFIYFRQEIVNRVLIKLSHSLVDGGFIFTGHSEIHKDLPTYLTTKVFPESLVYQKRMSKDDGTRKIEIQKEQTTETEKLKQQESLLAKIPLDAKLFTPANQKNTQHRLNTTPKTPRINHHQAAETTTQNRDTGSNHLKQAVECYYKGNYQEAFDLLQKILQKTPSDFAAVVLLARIHANRGEYALSKDCCEKALKMNSFAPEPYFLQAQLAEALGNKEEAKLMLRKVIYLNPEYVSAYLELSDIYEQELEEVKAKKMRQTALEILSKLPNDKVVEPYDDVRVETLIPQIQVLIGS